ncbi:MAG: cryptochrome/photolyase family protein, partial [Flavitalea sp.]
MEITLIFPHQLYKNHPALQSGNRVYLIEDELYFLQYPFHKKKLVLHRAGMKYFEETLQQQKFETTYIECSEPEAKLDKFFGSLKGISLVHYVDTTDYLLERRLNRYSKKYGISLKKYESPNFLTTVQEIYDYFGEGKRFFMADFYRFQRKRLGIMVSNKEPVGGKWSFDEENRKKLPKNTIIPGVEVYNNKFINEATNYVEKLFPDNYGETGEFNFPVTHEEAEQSLTTFLEERFESFGVYQDAINKDQSFLFHSNISSSLNIGLLDPEQVVQATLTFAQKKNIPINSVEGFIRQIIGWREYIRAVYILKGVEERTKNHFGFDKKMPEAFWDGSTQINPIDVTIQRLLKTAYAHHIERLMVLGNIMLLAEIHPDDVYKWFMSLFIDAYDWVMVPNVYGMSQFADGGLMSTKPYISGSNYLLKMSDYKKSEWSELWDALFWRFMNVHLETF